jgi:hypothetical protein
MGSHCDRLRVVLRIATREGPKDGDPRSADHEATFLLGHTERITFLGDLWVDRKDLYHEAVLHVPCRFLRRNGNGDSCGAHGFHRAARDPRPDPAEPRAFPGDRFTLVEAGKVVTRVLPPPPRHPRSLPVQASANPCATAPCRTADNTKGAACCRDFQIEIMCTRRQGALEALVRSRKSPYLCKVERESPYSLSGEFISACGFLMEDGVNCVLHGRKRPDGRPAKPDLCSEWPETGDLMHPGCVFRKAAGPGS